MTDNTRKKALIIQQMVREHYQPERQDRCKLWVWRNVVIKKFPMSERTFWRYLAFDVNAKKKETSSTQLRLFE